MPSAPIILVPGFWLGAWAWDEVASTLRAAGHDVLALTLPGLESPEDDAAAIRFEDHVAAICDAVRAAERPVVLAVHSGASQPGYAASDRVADRIVAMVYVDTAPGTGPIDPDFADAVKAFPGIDQLREQESLDGLSPARLDEFERRAMPEPGEAVRGWTPLTNPARLAIPSTIIATSYTAQQYQEGAAQGYPWLGGINELLDLSWIDLPTSHWPMWSRPAELAEILGRIATEHAAPA